MLASPPSGSRTSHQDASASAEHSASGSRACDGSRLRTSDQSGSTTVALSHGKDHNHARTAGLPHSAMTMGSGYTASPPGGSARVMNGNSEKGWRASVCNGAFGGASSSPQPGATCSDSARQPYPPRMSPSECCCVGGCRREHRTHWSHPQHEAALWWCPCSRKPLEIDTRTRPDQRADLRVGTLLLQFLRHS